jgi:hypothetical protein
VKVVAGATVSIAHDFFKKLFEKGGHAISRRGVDPPYLSPSVAVLELSQLRELIKAFSGGAEKPIWVTEFSRARPAIGFEQGPTRHKWRFKWLQFAQKRLNFAHRDSTVGRGFSDHRVAILNESQFRSSDSFGHVLFRRFTEGLSWLEESLKRLGENPARGGT